MTPAFSRLWLGEITDLASEGPMVLIEQLTGSARHHGPCLVVEGVWSAVLATVTGAASGGTAHSHPIAVPAALAVGDHVVIGFIAGKSSQPIVLARIAS